MHSEVPLCTSHGAEPFGASELAGRGKAFTVLTFKHWKWEEKTTNNIVKTMDITRIVKRKPHIIQNVSNTFCCRNTL